MADRIAKVHHNVSNRAQKPNAQKKQQKKHSEKPQQTGQSTSLPSTTGQSKPPVPGAKNASSGSSSMASDKKIVYRSVLDNPFKVDWPKVPMNVENSILACIVDLLSPVATYQTERHRQISRARGNSRKSRQRQRKPAKPQMKKACGNEKEGVVEDIEEGPRDKEAEDGRTMAIDVEPRPVARVTKPHPNITNSERSPEVTGKRKKITEPEADDTQTGEDIVDTRRHKRRKHHPTETKVTHDIPLAQSPNEEHRINPSYPSADSGPNAPIPQLPITKPVIFDHIIIGINNITKRLELQSPAYNWLQRKSSSTAPDILNASAKQHAPIRLVLVNRSDIDTPAIISHFPTLIAACNSSRNAPSSQASTAQPKAPTTDHPGVNGASEPCTNTAVSDVLLVPLPRGAEESIAAAIGMRRVAAVALDAETPGIERLSDLLSSVPILTAAWLGSASPPLIPTHIKQLKTTAPKDMKLVKEQRSKRKAAAKKLKKLKSSPNGQAPSQREGNRSKKVPKKPTVVFSAAVDGIQPKALA